MPTTLRFDVCEYAPGRQPAHDHDEVHLSIVLRGSVTETVGARTEQGGPLSVVVKDRGVRHANQFGQGGATLARLSLVAGVSDLLDDPRRVVEWCWTHNQTAVASFLRVIVRQRGLGQDVPVHDADVVDLLSALSARPVDCRRRDPPRWLVDVLGWLNAEWHPALTVADAAAYARVHPVYLARCVRRWFGHSVGDELRRLRLGAAAQRVAFRDEGLSRVALDAGYADQAHFCREFRRATGLRPSAYRDAIRWLTGAMDPD
ncbi:MAG TPA: AraC family transcriptional regulator [Gemmatimonadaceae bacterium]|nr:AraC family transcriptional regulator [Gemmatimonadaceae bacterium]